MNRVWCLQPVFANFPSARLDHVLPVWLEPPTRPYMIPQDPFLSFSLSPNPATQRASEHREGTKRPSSAFLELLLQLPPLKLPQPPKSLPEGSIFYHMFTILGHKPSMWWTHHRPLPTTHKISLLSFDNTTSLVPSLGQENPSGRCLAQIYLLLYLFNSA